MKIRLEHDTMGEIAVPADRLWGAQTQRSLENFRIGTEKMPEELIRSVIVIKKASALANNKLGVLDSRKCRLICRACDELLEGNMGSEFPLSVWQTGSGTQSNMNVNEVISNIINLRENQNILHPNDDVNKSQSTNDVFPSAMHISAYEAVRFRLLPAVRQLEDVFSSLSERYESVIKTGRTHMQDAVPVSLGQEIGAWAFMLKKDAEMAESALVPLKELASGATAAGTGLNAPENFAAEAVRFINEITGGDFKVSRNLFHALSSKDELVFAHGALKALAADLMKIANDVRMLSSGPRSGICEITIPENEPGSSIMPGKVNPTQCEALSMVCIQVMANDTAVAFAAGQGHYQLNAYMPLIIYSFLQSVRLLTDAVRSFTEKCASGIKPNYEGIKNNLDKSLMTVTALNPIIGYENSAETAKYAFSEGITLKEAALKLKKLSEEEFDSAMDLNSMVYKEKK